MKTLRIARYQLRAVFRSRWILFYGAFFLAVTGAVFQRFFGSGVGQAITATALLAWALVPAGLGLRAFCRKNF